MIYIIKLQLIYIFQQNKFKLNFEGNVRYSRNGRVVDAGTAIPRHVNRTGLKLTNLPEYENN